MTIDAQMLRSMRDELLKTASPADRRMAAAEKAMDVVKGHGPYRTGVMPAASTAASAAGPGLKTRVMKGLSKIKDKVVRGVESGAEGVAHAAKAVPRAAGAEYAKGVRDVATPEALREAGGHAAEGALAKLRPSRKAMIGAGAAVAGLGGLAAYAKHRQRKRDRVERKQDMHEAMSSALQAQGGSSNVQ